MNYFKEVYKRRELFYRFVIKDLKIRYKGSILGYAWSVFTPVITMLFLVIVFSKFMKFNYENYPVFVLTGIITWNLFSSAVTNSAVILYSNANLITKIYFPRESLPLSIVFSKTVDFLIALAVLFIFLIYYKIEFTWLLLLIPLIFVFHFLFTLGISLLVSCLNLFYRDVKYILELVLFLWFYATPIIYPITMIPDKYLVFYYLNPMAAIVTLYRDALIYGRLSDWKLFAVSAVGSAVVFILSFMIFKYFESRFAEEL